MNCVLSTGVLIVGHGTRDSIGLAEFAETVQQLALKLPTQRIAAAFLELAEPDIPHGIQQLAEAGVDQITVMPLLLFAAGHAKRDIPAAVAQAEAIYPALGFRITEALGCHAELLEISAARFAAAVAGQPLTLALSPEYQGEGTRKGEGTRLILAARGGSDAEAIAAVQRYATLLASKIGVLDYSVAFVAVAQPRLGDVLARFAAEDGGPIVVVPHLLFAGDVLGEVHSLVAHCAEQHPDVEFFVTDHVGPDPRLVALLAAMVVGQSGSKHQPQGASPG